MINAGLIDLLDRFKIDVFSSLNCVGIGIIESLTPDKKYATLSMAYKIRQFDAEDEKSSPVEYPALVDCPLFRISGGGAGLFMPIKKGDTAIILFNDVDMDNFIASKNVAIPDSDRLHSFSDAIALVGIENEFQDLEEDAGIYNDQSLISIGEKIAFKNATFSLLEIMLELTGIVKELKPLTTAPGDPTSPNPSDGALVLALEEKIKGLLK